LTNHKKVIILKQSLPAAWSFFDFVYLSGGTPIKDWCDSLSDYGRELVNGLLKTNHKIENPINWSGFRKYLKGELKGEGIWELGFYADDVQYRLLGIFDGAKKAIFLMGCYHKGGNYTPIDALGTALKRKKLFAKGECRLHERQVKLDQ
jgi:Phage derived protein Gp49-like (DUF891)